MWMIVLIGLVAFLFFYMQGSTNVIVKTKTENKVLKAELKRKEREDD